MPAAAAADSEPARPFRVIAVTSGKGGVGKTNLVVNLAVTYAKAGRKVLVVDGDLGLANVDILLDAVPEVTLADVLGGAEIGEALVAARDGVTVLPGTSGVSEMAHLSPEQRINLLEAIDELDGRFDTVLIDTAAGVGDNAVFFASAAQEVLVVVTPEPTSLADGYAMVKVLARRGAVRRVGLVVNQASPAGAREAFFRLSGLVGRFLPDVVLELIGTVPSDRHVHEAVMEQKPVVEAFPASPAALALGQLADAILMRSAPQGSSGRLQLFWRQLLA